MLKVMLLIHIYDELYIGKDLLFNHSKWILFLLIRIILNLICFIAPIGSLRNVGETLFQRLCLSQTTNERSDLLIVLNEVRRKYFDLIIFVFRMNIIGDYKSIINIAYITSMDSFNWRNQWFGFKFISKVNFFFKWK